MNAPELPPTEGATIPPPPMVQVVRLPSGEIQVAHNMKEPILALGLLAMGQILIGKELTTPAIVQPSNGVQGLLKRMRR